MFFSAPSGLRTFFASATEMYCSGTMRVSKPLVPAAALPTRTGVVLCSASGGPSR
jgi:hypothetical protein